MKASVTPLEARLALRSFAFDRLSAIAAVLDRSGTIVDTNEAWRLFAHLNDGTPAATGPGVNYLEVCDRAMAAGATAAGPLAAGLRQILAGERETFDLDYPCPSPEEDRWFMVQATSAPVDDGGGVVLFHVDISSRRLLEARLAQDANHDELTGLPNRRAAVRFLEAELTETARTGRPLQVMYADLDGFKAVNDTHGHHVGDQLLAQVAARARRVLRDGDLLSRFGGDEFVLAHPDTDETEVRVIADRLHTVMAKPFQVGAVELEVGLTIGIAVSEEGSTVDSILAAADAQMYRGKAGTRRPRSEPVASATTDAPGLGDGVSAPRGRVAPRFTRGITEAVVAHSSDLVMLFRIDGTIEWVSPAARQVFGIEPEDLIGMNGLSLVHPDDQARVFVDFASIPSLGDLVRTEFRVIDAAGKVRWVEEIATNLVDEPSVGAVVGNIRDITDRRAAEEVVRFQARLLAAVGQAVVAIDTGGTVLFWNNSAHLLFGWTSEEVVGRPAADVLPPAHGSEDQGAEILACLLEGLAWSGEIRVRSKDGGTVPLAVTNTPVLDDDGVLVATIGVSSDISDRLRSEEASALLSAVVESSSDAIYAETLDGVVTTWNESARRLYGYAAEEIVGRHVSQLIPLARLDEAEWLLEQVRAGRTVQECETVRRSAGGDDLAVSLAVSPVRDAAGTIVGASTIARDITERTALHQRLEAERRRLADAQASARLGSFEIDLVTGEASRSDELCRILGVEPGMDNRATLDFVHPDDLDRVRAALEEAMGATGAVESTHRIVRPDGEVRWVVSRTSSFRDADAVVLSGTVLDVTERHEAELAIAHQATHDPLTGLPNRSRLVGALAAALGSDDTPVAVALVDLDQFKSINDTFGHAVGDETLRAVAGRLRGALRESDELARFGGDEFVLVRRGVGSLAEARALAQVAQRCLDDPLVVGDRRFTLTASVGVTVSERVDTPESLLRDADAALYQAKEDGRARVAVFDQSARSRAHRRRTVEFALSQAVDRGQLRLAYQPVLDTLGGHVAGFEALLRWDHPGLGAIAPDEFIPLAERSGLIVPIGDWVIVQALTQLAAWRRELPDADLWMAVNLAATQLADPALPQRLARAIADAGLPPEAVHVEITESILMDRVENALATVVALRATGVRISIDDFGTGYSSLSYLHRLPIDVLKIDRSFIDGLDQEGPDRSIVRAITSLAHTLTLQVVAEGVETEGQLALIRAAGCGFAQGFLWSRALPPDEALAWMREHPSPS